MKTDNMCIPLSGFGLVGEIKLTRINKDPLNPDLPPEQMLFVKTGDIDKLERLGDLFWNLGEGVREQLEELRFREAERKSK